MVVFPIVIAMVVKAVQFQMPWLHRPVKIDYAIAPLLGVALLFVTNCIDTETLWRGIEGNEKIRPYAILILFNALAYVCISLDKTGFFAFLALWTAKKAGTSGPKFFLYFFFLSSILTTFTSNDIVILTLTPLICYFAHYTKLNPIPYLVAEFFAANIWSVALYIGNPTNIIVAEAYRLTFAGYSAWMLLPTLVAGVSCLALLWLVFHKEIPREIQPPEIQPQSALKDTQGAIFGVITLLSCLVLLSFSFWLEWDIWKICLVTCMVMMCRDVALDVCLYHDHRFNWANSNVREVLRRMPWKIVPFVVGMFTLVEALSQSGWTTYFATWISAASSNLWVAVFFMGFLSSLAANLINNQPMTILFTQITQDSAFVVAAPVVLKGSMFALIMGSNFGANFTLIGALAGIMWSSILVDKKITISYGMFFKYGFLIMPVVVALSCLTLAIELYFFG